jgi:uncharacterized RDD family membrane protein YckC
MSHGIGGRGLEGAGAGDLVLEFGPEPPSRVGELPLHPEPAIDSYRARPTNDAAVPVSRVAMRTAAEPATAAAAVTVTAPRSSSGVLRPRAVAGLIDHGILLGIDAVVLYFTLRMTGLTASEWSVLPLAPLLAFLVFVKLAYFGTFTVIGGQTIGKMATRLRVVTDDARTVGLSQGLWRAAASLASVASLGAGLLPILLGNDRRAFHDRVAGTRVVSIPHA